MVFSRCTLMADGHSWFRLWSAGPGLAIHDAEYRIGGAIQPLPFSIRYGFVKHLRIGRYAIVFVKSWGGTRCR